MPDPGDAVTWREAGAILGAGMWRVGALIAKGQLARGPRWQHRQLSRAEYPRQRGYVACAGERLTRRPRTYRPLRERVFIAAGIMFVLGVPPSWSFF
jgi:hypothetical protein